MLEPLDKTKLADLFTIYFGQDYDLFTKIDESKPFIPQAIASYKQDSNTVSTSKAIAELRTLINLNYSEKELKKVFRKLGSSLNISYYGLTHQEFLIEVLEALERDRKKIIPSQQQTIEDDLSNFSPYVYPPKPDHIIPIGIEGLLTVYFAKDYDELVEQYGKMRLITQIVAKYKEDQHPAYVKVCLDEVERLVNKQHDEKYLQDLIANEYGVKIPISKLGGAYQIFLERLHEELLGKRIYT